MINDPYYYHDGLDQSILVDELILEASDPGDVFRDSTEFGGFMSNVDDSAFGWIAGKIQSPAAPDPHGIPFILIPQLPMPTPGITVAPTTGRVTSEGGGADSFDVVLDKEPTANVTIGISSSDISEGTVDVSSLTFTSANWETPQTVTVTGVDDLDADGIVSGKRGASHTFSSSKEAGDCANGSIRSA